MDKGLIAAVVFAGIGAAVIAYILLTRRAYAYPAPAPPSTSQQAPPAYSIEIADYEVY